MEPDFQGWATKFGVKCSDGRTIRPGSFKIQPGAKVPLVWQHGHDKPENVLGHVLLEVRGSEGVWAQGFFNSTPTGQHQKAAVEHGDVDSMSIYANRLQEQDLVVSHGVIREVSLVLAGANAMAKIEHVTIRHSDGDEDVLEDEAIIHVGSTVEVAEEEELDFVQVMDSLDDEQKNLVLEFVANGGEVSHADGDRTVKQVLDTLNEEQAAVFGYIIQQLGNSAEHSDNEGDPNMGNVFEKDAKDKALQHDGSGPQTLSHDALNEIVTNAKAGGSFKAAVEGYALAHGIENIESLFPEPKDLTNSPQWITRNMAWVATVMNGITRTPFSRIKTSFADLTYEAARAKGYIKGSLKKEEFFGMFKRETAPGTIYKKQKLDRDDIVDITSYDVVSWLKGEMRLMLSEEVARAILLGDGRSVDDEDKVDATKIRPVAYEEELYAASVELNIANGYAGTLAFIDRFVETRQLYKGTGAPTFFTTTALLTRMLLVRDGDGRRLYRTEAELAQELRVSAIVEVEAMEAHSDLYGVLVNLTDYRVGTDRGGEVTMFDQFDIDYNQYKYLAETRFAGALVVPRSAIVYRVAGADTLATPVTPAYNKDTKVVTIPTTTGVDYLIDGVVKPAGTYTLTSDTRVYAQAKAGYFLAQPFEAKYSPAAS